jgi:hypothetical protein
MLLPFGSMLARDSGLFHLLTGMRADSINPIELRQPHSEHSSHLAASSSHHAKRSLHFRTIQNISKRFQDF